MTNSTDERLELLTNKNSILALVDYQAAMFKGVASGDKTIIKNAAVGAAKAASILGIPVVLSSINPKFNGEFIPEITSLFPNLRHTLLVLSVLRLSSFSQGYRDQPYIRRRDSCPASV